MEFEQVNPDGLDETREVRLKLARESGTVVIGVFHFGIVSFPGSSHFLYSDYIIPQFLKNVKRVLNIFYGSFVGTFYLLCTISTTSLRPYIREFVNSSTDTSDYLFWSISPFLFIPYYNRFLLFIYLFIKKNEKQRKNKEERISGNVKLKQQSECSIS